MSQGLIQGSMREAPLPDIIQLVSQGGKTGCFHVSDDLRRAKIYLKAGRIVHAVTNDHEGLDAVYEVALWLDGNYHFEENDAVEAATITKPNPSILMEMHRRMDEWRVLSQKIPSLDLHPNSTLLPGETPSGVNPREAKLLSIITGYYTVGELAEVLQKPVLNVAKDLYGLIMSGHVLLKGVRSGKRPDMGLEEPGMAVLTPIPAVAAVAEPRAAIAEPQPLPMADPVRLAKLNNFSQRIAQAAKSVLPMEHHEMVNRLLARAGQQLLQGEGPEAVKNLALAVSRGAVDAGCDGDTVKNLNAHLKALFAK